MRYGHIHTARAQGHTHEIYSHRGSRWTRLSYKWRKKKTFVYNNNGESTHPLARRIILIYIVYIFASVQTSPHANPPRCVRARAKDTFMGESFIINADYTSLSSLCDATSTEFLKIWIWFRTYYYGIICKLLYIFLYNGINACAQVYEPYSSSILVFYLNKIL